MSVQAIRDYVAMIREMQEVPSAVKFLDNLMERGDAFTSVDWDVSQKLANIFGCKVQDCYANCQKTMFFEDDYRYFEGYIAGPFLAVEHAWLVDGKGVVIDPTMVLLQDKLNGQELTYFGVQLPTEFVANASLGDEIWGPCIEEGFLEGVW